MSRLPPSAPLVRPTRRPGEHGKAGGRLNSVGMNERQLDAMMAPSGGIGGGRSDRRRKFVRWPFRQSSLDLVVAQPGGTTTTCRVACRNLSCGGLSVVHSAFVYPGSPCVAHLPRPGGTSAAVGGVIVRCAHVVGMVHEIGIRFSQQIAAGEYVDNDPMAGQFSLEVVEPESLVGVLLCVEDSRLDQKLIQHYLRGTSIRLRIAEDAGEAAAVASQGCDIVLCDFHVGAAGAGAVVEAVRGVLPEVPVIVVTADCSRATTELIRRMPVNAFLPKPFTDAMLQRALGEFLIARKDRALESSVPEGGSGIPAELAADLANDLAEFQGKLETTIRDSDPTSCYVVCQQIAATAHSLRLGGLARVAQEASASLATTMSIPDSEKQIKELIGACGKQGAA